jgi:hypothetical protein
MFQVHVAASAIVTLSPARPIIVYGVVNFRLFSIRSSFMRNLSSLCITNPTPTNIYGPNGVYTLAPFVRL